VSLSQRVAKGLRCIAGNGVSTVANCEGICRVGYNVEHARSSNACAVGNSFNRNAGNVAVAVSRRFYRVIIIIVNFNQFIANAQTVVRCNYIINWILAGVREVLVVNRNSCFRLK